MFSFDFFIFTQVCLNVKTIINLNILWLEEEASFYQIRYLHLELRNIKHENREILSMTMITQSDTVLLLVLN